MTKNNNTYWKGKRARKKGGGERDHLAAGGKQTSECFHTGKKRRDPSLLRRRRSERFLGDQGENRD